jgi:hypothetical protein
MGSAKAEENLDVPPPPGFAIEPLSADDYFLKNHEFSAWLKSAKGKVHPPAFKPPPMLSCVLSCVVAKQPYSRYRCSRRGSHRAQGSPRRRVASHITRVVVGGAVQFFTELLADDARRLFDDFVVTWNLGQLTLRMYRGITVHGRR